MRRYTYFEAGKWRIKVGGVEFAGPWVDKLSYYEELAPNLENTKDEAYNLGYQTCLHAKGLTWSEARELQAYRATGLTVERAAELGKADSEGRVVVLPCKVGDKIYLRGKADKRTRSGARIVEQAISYIAIYDDWIDIDGICEAEELGEYAFLTREEAEKVLEAEDHE